MALWQILRCFGLFLLQLNSISCATTDLYNTKIATSDLKWTAGPDSSAYTWEEVSVYEAPTKDIIRAYQICNSGETGNDNWIRTPYIQTQHASRVHIEVEYSIQKCTSLGLDEYGTSLCRETFNMFYYPSQSDVATSTFPPWKHLPYTKIDTIAANTNIGINKKTFTVDGLKKDGVYIAFQDQGACMSLISVRVYHFYCPETTKNLAVFKHTLTGDDKASLVPVTGACVTNSNILNQRQPKYYCGGNGEWKIVTGECVCDEGTEPNKRHTACTVCPIGTYKVTKGNTKCLQCPANSVRKENRGQVAINDDKAVSGHQYNSFSAVCPCHKGYFRSQGDGLDTPCTQPPSEPSIITSQFNSTAVYLEWQPPHITGGRSDLYYSIECEFCGRFNNCVSCAEQTTYVTKGEGQNIIQVDHTQLRHLSVYILNLEPYSKYRFKISAYNGVSEISNAEPASANVVVETAQDFPLPIDGVSVSGFTMDTAMVEWAVPDHPRGEILIYEVELREISEGERTTRSSSNRNEYQDKDVVTKTSDEARILLNELTPNTEYKVRVRARTGVGFGQFGAPTSFRTKSDIIVEAGSFGDDQSKFLVASIVAVIVAVVACFGGIIICSRRQKQLRDNNLVSQKKHLSSRYDEISETKQMTVNMQEQERLAAKVAAVQKLHVTYVDYPDPHRAVLALKMELPDTQLTLEDSIGEGEFAQVRIAKLQSENGPLDVAVKQLKEGATAKDRSNFLREACIMAQFDHPNILKLKGVVTKEEPMMIISEFMSNGSLDKYLRNSRHHLNMSTLLHMLRGIASGMQYLSDMQYVHRDLAARNILVDNDGNCKVADFGLSRNCENDPNATYTTQGGKIALRWTAPESIRYREFTSASDVWSFGIVMWELMSYGEKPYWDMTNKEIIKNVSDGGRLPAPTRCPKAIHEMMLECWILDPKKRPTFTKIVSDLNRLIRHSTLLETCVTPTQDLSTWNETVGESLANCARPHEDADDSDSDLEGQVTVIVQERALHV